jgi:hypothetical protein
LAAGLVKKFVYVFCALGNPPIQLIPKLNRPGRVCLVRKSFYVFGGKRIPLIPDLIRKTARRISGNRHGHNLARFIHDPVKDVAGLDVKVDAGVYFCRDLAVAGCLHHPVVIIGIIDTNAPGKGVHWITDDVCRSSCGRRYGRRLCIRGAACHRSGQLLRGRKDCI